MSNVHLLSLYSRVKNDRATNKYDQKHSELNIWLFIWSDTRYNSLDHVPLYLERKIDKNISEQKTYLCLFYNIYPVIGWPFKPEISQHTGLKDDCDQIYKSMTDRQMTGGWSTQVWNKNCYFLSSVCCCMRQCSSLFQQHKSMYESWLREH